MKIGQSILQVFLRSRGILQGAKEIKLGQHDLNMLAATIDAEVQKLRHNDWSRFRMVVTESVAREAP